MPADLGLLTLRCLSLLHRRHLLHAFCAHLCRRPHLRGGTILHHARRPLAIGMLVSGTANTLTCKATLSTVSNGGAFDHPFIMAACMFSGEILCLVSHTLSRCCSTRSRGARAEVHVPKHIFALPALCDILGTSTMYVGLTLTSASIYQMLRGSVIIFTGALSAVYLRRRIHGHQWLAMSAVFCGVLVVGCAALTQVADASQQHAGTQALLGSLLVVAAQCFTALQMVVEERFVTGYNVPALMAVGWEGIWGLAGVTALLVVLQHTTAGGAAHHIEESMWAISQIYHEPRLHVLMSSNALSIERRAE